jgi:hypothetical protein
MAILFSMTEYNMVEIFATLNNSMIKKGNLERKFG